MHSVPKERPPNRRQSRQRKNPPHYLKKYGITNLYRVAIGNSRLTYTIIADKDKKVLCILEYFPAHRERFGYDT
jgi:mRNA-degrading endonuclease RelE of RelBE toxin-antitoxin system